MGTVSSLLTEQIPPLEGLTAHAHVVSICPFGEKVTANLSQDVSCPLIPQKKVKKLKNHLPAGVSSSSLHYIEQNPTWLFSAFSFTQVSQNRLCVIPKTANRGHEHDDLTQR